ncbi:hypothetical protein BaRGS_00019988 [Batillaria attramentaria]|uniref:Uncharacterized protein n=1 Tax=Batillaria attramentaria TaxID=370345 RepID=A0ABD0KP47_9CAEN
MNESSSHPMSIPVLPKCKPCGTSSLLTQTGQFERASWSKFERVFTQTPYHEPPVYQMVNETILLTSKRNDHCAFAVTIVDGQPRVTDTGGLLEGGDWGYGPVDTWMRRKETEEELDCVGKRSGGWTTLQGISDAASEFLTPADTTAGISDADSADGVILDLRFV